MGGTKIILRFFYRLFIHSETAHHDDKDSMPYNSELGDAQHCYEVTPSSKSSIALIRFRWVHVQVARQRELRLIENQHMLKDAPIQYKAEAL